jgi:hypothetical protein
LTITGLQSGIDLSNYDTLSIPATCVIGGAEYRVIAIGKQAFRGSFSSYPIDNSNIIRLDLSNASNLDIINDLAFMDCDSLTGSLTIPNSVTSISDDAFN